MKENGLSENTLIIFTSDNGTAGNISNLRNGRLTKGGKMKTTENGINTPFIVSWPGHISSNTSSDALIDFSDMLPTFAELAGASLEKGYEYDGISFLNILKNPSSPSSRKWILSMGSHPGIGTVNGIENTHRFRDRVIRDQTLKAFVNSKGVLEKLVDLSKDLDEKNNLLNSSKYKSSSKEFKKIIDSLPKIDNDPIYTIINNYPVYREGNIPSGIHKK